jgi:acetyl-CoA acyltransferase 2
MRTNHSLNIKLYIRYFNHPFPIFVYLEMSLYIIEASRTAFGCFSGKLKDVSAIELGRIVSQSVLQKLSTEAPHDIVDNVVFGNVLQTSQDAAYLARHISLKSGIKQSIPAVTVNRLCGSGFEAMIVAAMTILLKRSDVAVVGGTESMSQAPFVLRGIRDGIKFNFGSGNMLEDTLSTALTDTYTGEKMGDTAENIAIKYGISRKDCDLFAQRSHKLAKRGKNDRSIISRIHPTERL